MAKFNITTLGLKEKDAGIIRSFLRLFAKRLNDKWNFISDHCTAEADVIIYDDSCAHTIQSITKGLSLHYKHSDIMQPIGSSDFINLFNKFAKQLYLLDSAEEIPNLSVQPQPQPQSVDIQSKRELPEKTIKMHRILTVDDSLAARRFIGIELEKLNIRVDFAETGEDALQYIQKNEYNLIFLDVILPGINGYDVCRLIKKNVQRKMTPVVMLTSKSSPFDKVKGKLSGSNAYLTKPVNEERFQEVLKTYLVS